MNRTIAFSAFLIWLGFIQAGCFLPYVTKQGYYQVKLLWGQQPISEALQRDAISHQQRENLKLILAIKDFATQDLAFLQNNNYTTVNLQWNHTLYSVSGSKPLRFEPYTWWFPIVGKVPYKGFFDKSDAIKEKARLTSKNLDVQMATVSGYSSLGYFQDPVWPQMLDLPTVFLVELIIHELAHATIYFKNQTDFNESFANAVGKIGALAFLKKHFGKKSQEYQSAILIYDDEALYNTHMWQLYQQLEAIYKSEQSSIEKQTLKKQTISYSIATYRNIPFSTSYFKNRILTGINNASLMSFKRYHSEQNNFERLLSHCEHNWRKFILKIGSLETAPDPLILLNQQVEKL